MENAIVYTQKSGLVTVKTGQMIAAVTSYASNGAASYIWTKNDSIGASRGATSNVNWVKSTRSHGQPNENDLTTGYLKIGIVENDGVIYCDGCGLICWN